MVGFCGCDNGVSSFVKGMEFIEHLSNHSQYFLAWNIEYCISDYVC